MQTTKTPYQLINDFLYVNDDVLGPSYKNGSYLIGVGRNTYSCNYQGQCFRWGLEDFLSAVEACVKHARDVERKLIPSAYTQRRAQGKRKRYTHNGRHIVEELDGSTMRFRVKNPRTDQWSAFYTLDQARAFIDSLQSGRDAARAQEAQ